MPFRPAVELVAMIDPPPAAMRCGTAATMVRSEEHTSELQSLRHLVCRLLLEKKNNRRLNGNREASSVQWATEGGPGNRRSDRTARRHAKSRCIAESVRRVVGGRSGPVAQPKI